MNKGNLVSGLRSWVIAVGLSVATLANAQQDPIYAWTNFVGQPERGDSLDGIGTAARFYYPWDVTIDRAGTVFVADMENHTIRSVSAAGEVTTLAGWARSQGSADGPGSSARFNSPVGVDVDSVGNLYVADTGNHAIRKITAAGEVTTLAGVAGSPGSADGAGSAARFNGPQGVAVDAAGNVYVADTANHLIRRVTTAGEVTTLAGVAGSAGSADGFSSAPRFNYPNSVTVDVQGDACVADTQNHTIRKVTADGVVSTLAGRAGSPGVTDGIRTAARFNSPGGVAIDRAGIVYVADRGSSTIRKIAAEGMVTTIGGVPGMVGSTDGLGGSAGFSLPSGLALDGAETLYVADSWNHRITKGVAIFPPAITAQPVSLLNDLGTTATFSVTATGTDPLDYQWRLNGTNVAGATNSTLTLTKVQSTNAGNYSVLVTNLAGWTVSSNALLTVNLPPIVSISSPTNGTVLLAPASFTLLANATDDQGVAWVEFWSETNFLGVSEEVPWQVPQLNLPAGEYHYSAVAVDVLGFASTSAVSTVTVLSRPPTQVQALVTNGLLVRQTGLLYQTVRVSNPTPTPLAALRVWVELDAASVARGVQVSNATGRSNGIPYLAYNIPLAPGQNVDLQVEYYVPDRQPFPNPVFRAEVAAQDPPVEPQGTPLGFVRQVWLTNGLFLVELSTMAGRQYYVQYGSNLTNWTTASPAVLGNGSKVQWVDTGPPKTESRPSSATNRFYRVLLAP
jgi:sugar lactone lactonase YvrE